MLSEIERLRGILPQNMRTVMFKQWRACRNLQDPVGDHTEDTRGL